MGLYEIKKKKIQQNNVICDLSVAQREFIWTEYSTTGPLPLEWKTGNSMYKYDVCDGMTFVIYSLR